MCPGSFLPSPMLPDDFIHLQLNVKDSNMYGSVVTVEVQKFILKFTNQFVKYPIRNFVYKPACQFQCEFLNFAMKFRTFQ